MFKKKRRWHCLPGQEPTELDKKVMYWENKGKEVPTRDMVRTPEQIEGIRIAGKLNSQCLDAVAEGIHPGMNTQEIDDICMKFCEDHGCHPSCLNFEGYPKSVCTSINEVVCHGIPKEEDMLQEGDIVSVDVGAYIGGFHGDCAATFPCGKLSPEAQDLINVTRQSFFEGIRFAREGHRLLDISAAIQQYVESHGYSVVREYVGHGVGAQMHEAPEIPNYGHPGRGPRLLRGMTLAIEPMVNAGSAAIRQMSDGWTVKTLDGKWAAHYENTVLVTDGEPEILTVPVI